MCEVTEIMNEILAWNWSGIISGVTGLITVWIANKALVSWQKQHKAEKYTSFLDELTNAIHEYIQLMSIPIQQLKLIKINIDCYQNNPNLNNSLLYPEAVLFIEKKGEEEAQILISSLSTCQKSLNKIQSLSTKGQVLNIENYNKCYEACQQITWQYGRIQAFYVMIGRSHLNWENEQVTEALGSILDITPEDIQRHLDESHSKYMSFFKDTYGKLYPNT